jgi:hypothetical protein
VWEEVGREKVGGRGLSASAVGELGAEHPETKINASVKRIMVEGFVTRMSDTANFISQC